MESKGREPGVAVGSDSLGAYVCGPPAMTDEAVAALKLMGLPNVYSEQWW